MSGKDLNYYMNLPYKIELLPEEDDTGFTAVVPDLKGCISVGDTIQEAFEMITDAKRLWIETALEKGWTVPEPRSDEIRTYSGRFNVRLPRSLHRELAELAEAEATSLNQLVVSLLSRGAEQLQQPRPPTRVPRPDATPSRIIWSYSTVLSQSPLKVTRTSRDDWSQWTKRI